MSFKSNGEKNTDIDNNNELIKTSVRRKKGYIPYGTIYDKRNEFRKQGYWISGLPIAASIIKVEKDRASHYHIFNPFIYTIELQHGKYKWQVIKHYQDFYHLRNSLIAHRAVEKIKFPYRKARDRIEDAIDLNHDLKKKTDQIFTLEKTSEFDEIDDEVDEKDDLKKDEKNSFSELSLPHFPIIPDLMVSESHMEERKNILEMWLQKVLNIPLYRNYHETVEFLEVSRFSFINELGGKYREGMVKKRPGGNKVYIGCKQFCVRWILPYTKRWLLLKDTYVCYMNPSNENIRLVLLFDKQFEINSRDLMVKIGPKELFLSNSQHVLAMKFARADYATYWIDFIQKVLNNTGKAWLEDKPYGSSFPPRDNVYCEWFVDAKDYFKKASAMIEMAREEIFIAGWWLCPEIYMRRPMAEGNYWRLDNILKRQAEKGVRIFVLVYKEMELALYLNSLQSKRHLQNLHPNIKVMRHPDHFVGTGTFFWAHHEKLLIIDQLIAFIGGLDLCYGRWDDSRHVLTDLGSVQVAMQSEDYRVEDASKDKTQTNAIEIDKVVEIIKDEKNNKIGEKITTSLKPLNENEEVKTTKKNFREIMQRVVGKMSVNLREQTPGELIVEPDKVEINKRSTENGKPVVNFCNVATYAKSSDIPSNNSNTASLVIEPNNPSLLRRIISNLHTSKNKRRWRMSLDQEDTAEEYVINYCRLQETKIDVSGLEGAGKFWPGKDYVNYIVKDFVNLQQTYNDFINRYETPRTGWHDIHSIVYGSIARDISRHFIQRWNATKSEKLKLNDNYPFLLPKSYNSIKIPKVFINENTHQVEIQLLRSVSHWSALIDVTEDSIQQAYISLIDQAKHFIYIENQFFVSMINSHHVSNKICKALHNRILRAHKNDETFKVYIMIPLLPGFQGDIGNQYSSLLAVLHWTMLSICKGPNSLIENLKKSGVTKPKKYIMFCSLRNYDELCGKLVSEMIYIHCKLMIVDDLYTIIGSANINDRSQNGNRDSETCILVKDKNFVASEMNGKPYQAGIFSKSLRIRLMKEHLGLLAKPLNKQELELEKLLNDPVVEKFYYDVWFKIAKENTRIYENTFCCYPTNHVKNFAELLAWRGTISLAQTDVEAAKKNLKKIRGHLVLFSMKFLKYEDLSPTITSKENLVPSAVFT